MSGRKDDDLRLLTKAAELFARLSGTYPPEKVESSILSCGVPIEDQIVRLRLTYERYMDSTSCDLRDLVLMAKRGDMLLQFGSYVRLDEMMKTGRLDRLYKRRLRETKDTEAP
jgi:hypothetical protein